MTGRIVLGLVLLIPGACLSAWSAWIMYRDTRLSGWPTVRAEIISSSAERPASGEFSLFRISYAYEVEGKRYTSDRYSNKQKRYSTEEAERLVDRNPPGKPVLATYDPGDPSMAVLEHEFPVWTIPALIVGLLLACNGLLLVTGSAWFRQ